jgi:hypothetical protein
MFNMARPPRQDDPAPAPRRNRAQPIAADAQALGQRAFQRAGFSDSTLILHWEEIVGSDVAKLAHPLKLTDGPSGGVLTLKAEAAASVFLQHESRALCDRINAYLGRPAIQRLRFVFGSVVSGLPRPSPVSSTKAVPAGDPASGFCGPGRLRDALMGLAAVRNSRPSDHGD